MNRFFKSDAKWKVYIDRKDIQGICKNRKIDRERYNNKSNIMFAMNEQRYTHTPNLSVQKVKFVA